MAAGRGCQSQQQQQQQALPPLLLYMISWCSMVVAAPLGMSLTAAYSQQQGI
jgi:hypothetical protein